MTKAIERPRRGIKERLFGNPVALKELRSQMRGARAVMVLTLYLTLTGGCVVLMYTLQVEAAKLTSMPVGSHIGQMLFFGVVAIELFLVIFIGPSLTAHAISGERERRTYELLRTTLLSARTLVLGKLIAALAYIVLLLFATLPIQAIALLFGGVTPQEMAIITIILLASAFHFSTVGLYFSVSVKRTMPASVAAYSYALVSTLGLPLLSFLLNSLTSLSSNLHSPKLLQVSLIYLTDLTIGSSPITTSIASQQLIAYHQTTGLYWQYLSNGERIPAVSPWIIFTFLTIVTSIVLIRISVRRIRRIADE